MEGWRLDQKGGRGLIGSHLIQGVVWWSGRRTGVHRIWCRFRQGWRGWFELAVLCGEGNRILWRRQRWIGEVVCDSQVFCWRPRRMGLWFFPIVFWMVGNCVLGWSTSRPRTKISRDGAPETCVFGFKKSVMFFWLIEVPTRYHLGWVPSDGEQEIKHGQPDGGGFEVFEIMDGYIGGFLTDNE